MSFRVGVTRDLRAADGSLVHDLGLDALGAQPGVTWEFLARHEQELAAETVAGFDALMVFEPGGISAATLQGADRLRLIARFGMGLEAIDLDACAAHGVLVTTEPFAVRHVLPAGAMAMVLALAYKIVEKDRIVRAGRWDERFELIGAGAAGRTLGIIGLGNVGRGVASMAPPFGFRVVATDPYAGGAPEGVELLGLEELLQASDVVVVTCPLTPQTHHLLDAERLALLPRGAHVVNVARGPIVDTHALADALREGQVGAAALDVFETEPVEPDHPLLACDDVLLSPHAVAYTDAAFRGLGAGACAAVLAVARGERPEHIANPTALAHGH